MSNYLFDDGSFGPAVAHEKDRARGTAETTDLVHIGELWAAIRQHSLFIVICAIGVGALVMLATFTRGMTFSAVGQLYLGEVDRKASGGAAETSGGFDLSGGAGGQVASELEILQSPSLVRRAVLESGLNVSIALADQGRVSYLRWLISGRDLALIDGVRDEVRPVHTSLTPLVRGPQSYRVHFVDSSQYELWSKFAKLGTGKLGEPLTAGDLTLTLIQGTQREPRAGADYKIQVKPLDQVLGTLVRVLHVTTPKSLTPGESVNVVKLEYEDASPYLAATFLQKLMDVYLSERQSWKTEDASAAEAFVGNQLRMVRESRDHIQSKLAEYKTQNPVVVLDDEARGMVEQMGKYEEQRLAAKLQAAAFADLQKTLARPNPPIGAYLFGEANDAVLGNMATSLSQAREKLTDLESRFQGLVPEVRDQRAQVAGQLEAIRNYVSSRHRRAQENLGTLNSIIGQFQQKLKTVPTAALGVAQLTRESEVYDKTYAYLLERQQQAAIAKASTLSKNRILDMPQVPLWEDSPRLVPRLLSVLIGLLLGMGIVVFRSLFSSTFQGLADVRRCVGRVPILAAIPLRTSGRGRDKGKQAADQPLDLSTLPAGSSFAEAFRRIRAKLCIGDKTEGGRIIVITSPNDGDGKTTCALSLASALGAGGKSVLLVDANLRRPAGAAEGLEGVRVPGLRDALRDSCAWWRASQPIPQAFSTLYRLPSGGPDRPELLASERMLRLFSEWREAFDFVLIDCPSFPEASDALTLSQMADTTISVVRLTKTRKDVAYEHITQLAPATRSYGVIVNHVGVDRDRAANATESSPIEAHPAESADGSSARADVKPFAPIPNGLAMNGRDRPIRVPSGRADETQKLTGLR
jgi:tyrosine-protein kinase Etk/Wzc